MMRSVELSTTPASQVSQRPAKRRQKKLTGKEEPARGHIRYNEGEHASQGVEVMTQHGHRSLVCSRLEIYLGDDADVGREHRGIPVE